MTASYVQMALLNILAILHAQPTAQTNFTQIVIKDYALNVTAVALTAMELMHKIVRLVMVPLHSNIGCLRCVGILVPKDTMLMILLVNARFVRFLLIVKLVS